MQLMLSGGETQRLMLARALYKDAPFIILDEPTAALDSIAEADIYQKYDEMTKGKSSVYISHRLASTRFCSRILMLEQGEIQEEGTHEELLRQSGKYAALYEFKANITGKEMGKMKTNEKNISLKEALQLNHRAYKLFYRYYPKLILSQISLTIWKALTPYIIIYLSALVIEELAGDRSPDRIRFLVTITLLSGAGISLISAFLKKWKRTWSAGLGMKIKRILCEKLFDMDYCDLDDSKTMELYSSIIQNLNGPGWGLYNVLLNYEALCSEGFSIICGLSMTISLFTSQIPKTAEKLVFLNNPVCVTAIISVMVLITWFSPVLAGKAGKYWVRSADLHTFSNRLFAYYGRLGYDSKKAADMRIYQQEKICEKHNLSKENPFGSKGLFARYGKGPVGFYMAASSAVSVIFTGIAYVFVCLKAWAGAFGIGAVTKYISAVTKVYSSVSGCISTIEDMQNNAIFLKQTFEFLDIPNNMYQGSLTTEKRSDRKYEIEFRNVSFRYPGCEQYALRNINMKFEIGQKLAVVGMNGSGKTTFIKLLCRLYDPTEGEILLNGIDIRKYNYKEYMMIFSVVFRGLSSSFP